MSLRLILHPSEKDAVYEAWWARHVVVTDIHIKYVPDEVNLISHR